LVWLREERRIDESRRQIPKIESGQSTRQQQLRLRSDSCQRVTPKRLAMEVFHRAASCTRKFPSRMASLGSAAQRCGASDEAHPCIGRRAARHQKRYPGEPALTQNRLELGKAGSGKPLRIQGWVEFMSTTRNPARAGRGSELMVASDGSPKWYSGHGTARRAWPALFDHRIEPHGSGCGAPRLWRVLGCNSRSRRGTSSNSSTVGARPPQGLLNGKVRSAI